VISCFRDKELVHHRDAEFTEEEYILFRVFFPSCFRDKTSFKRLHHEMGKVGKHESGKFGKINKMFSFVFSSLRVFVIKELSFDF
jgi:hypothetical protein